MEANVVLRSFRCLSLALAAIFVGVVATLRVDAQAEQTRQITIVQDLAPIGVAFGQTLRYTWANTTPDTETRVFEPLRVAARLLASDGEVLAQASAAAVGAGEFQSFDFARAALEASGDPSTGRLQMRVEVTIIGQTKYLDIVLKRGRLFHSAVEVIDDVTGDTSVSMGGGFNELSLEDTAGKENSWAKPEGFQIISAGRDELIGVVPGQSLRLSASNPMPADDDRRFKMLFAFTVFDANGTVIAEGDEITLEPGESQSFDVPYSQLAAAGAEITGRVQVRTEMRRFFPGIVNRISAGGRNSPPASLELVDSSTGRTLMLISSKPKEIVVVGS